MNSGAGVGLFMLLITYVCRLRDNKEVKQSAKHMKKYQENDFALTINRVRMEDRGEYVVRAKNAYGSTEEVVFLDVQSEYNVFFSAAHAQCIFFRSARSRTSTQDRRTQTQAEAESITSIAFLGRTRFTTKIHVPIATSFDSGQSFVQIDLHCFWKTNTNRKFLG